MTDLERKIEAAIEAYLKQHDFEIETRDGDHFARMDYIGDRTGGLAINVTRLASEIVREAAGA